LLELAKLIHDAIGIESPRKFVVFFSLFGALLFASLGWLVDKGYRVKLRREAQSIPVLQAPHKTGNASTTGSNSPAVTGDGNSVTYDSKPEDQRKPDPPRTQP
jgi:hypothetical protein